jgi:hypothetical protein
VKNGDEGSGGRAAEVEGAESVRGDTMNPHLEQRYLNDVKFYTLVNAMIADFKTGHLTSQDLRDALVVAEEIMARRESARSS